MLSSSHFTAGFDLPIFYCFFSICITGGDSKTLMFVQISPSDKDLGETLSSLNFASRVRGIELGPAKKQLDTSELQKLKAMVGPLIFNYHFSFIFYIHIYFITSLKYQRQYNYRDASTITCCSTVWKLMPPDFYLPYLYNAGSTYEQHHLLLVGTDPY